MGYLCSQAQALPHPGEELGGPYSTDTVLQNIYIQIHGSYYKSAQNKRWL